MKWMFVTLFLFVGCGSVTAADAYDGGTSDSGVDIQGPEHPGTPGIDTETDGNTISDAVDVPPSLSPACVWDQLPHSNKPCNDTRYAECFYTRPDGTPDGHRTDCSYEGRDCVLSCSTLPTERTTTMTNEIGSTFRVNLDKILPPKFNTRISMDPERIEALAESFKASGQQSPVEVEEEDGEEGMYRLHYGSRRFEAAKLAGIPEILVTLKAPMNDLDQIYANAEENLQREDLTTFEKARLGAELREKGVKPTDAAKRLGMSKQYFTNLTKVFIKLPAIVRDAWEKASLMQLEGPDAEHTPSEVALMKACAWGFLLNEVATLKTEEEMISLFEATLKTLEAEETEGDNDDDDDDEEEGGRKKGKKGKGKRSSAAATIYKVTSERYGDLLTALKKKGNHEAFAAVQYLVGDRKTLTVGEVKLPVEAKKATKKAA